MATKTVGATKTASNVDRDLLDLSGGSQSEPANDEWRETKPKAPKWSDTMRSSDLATLLKGFK